MLLNNTWDGLIGVSTECSSHACLMMSRALRTSATVMSTTEADCISEWVVLSWCLYFFSGVFYNVPFHAEKKKVIDTFVKELERSRAGENSV